MLVSSFGLSLQLWESLYLQDLRGHVTQWCVVSNVHAPNGAGPEMRCRWVGLAHPWGVGLRTGQSWGQSAGVGEAGLSNRLGQGSVYGVKVSGLI